MPSNVSGRLETQTSSLLTLISDVRKGEIKVPKFQRQFVWKPEQALDLLDSVANNYPVGSLLFWKTHDRLAVDRNIGEFLLPDTPDLTPTNYVLDGQQRLTVIYSCLGASLHDSGFACGYDLEAEAFVELPLTPSLAIFPLRLSYDTTRMLNFRTALMTHPQHAILQRRLDALLETINRYTIPVVTLKDLTVQEVCPIFERINSSGTRLSTYDLLVAATWSESFDLNDETATIRDALSPKGFGDIDGDAVLKCLAAVQSASIKKPDVVGLRNLAPVDMDDLVERTKAALLRTVDLLTTEFAIYSWDFLPYEALLIVTCRIFSDNHRLTEEQIRRLRQWFWRSGLSERYRGASESYVSQDIINVSNFVTEEYGAPEQFGVSPSAATIRDLEFRSNNSRSRAFVLALALQKPRNLTNGMRIDTAEALSEFNKKQFHHIFPKAFLRRSSADGSGNVLPNICMLTATENRQVSDRDPHHYLVEYARRLGAQADTVFQSNALPSPRDNDYATLEYRDFIESRSQLLHTLFVRLCEGDAS